MRTNKIGPDISRLLDRHEMDSAFTEFRNECDHLLSCPYSDNKNNCVVLCLLPKLIHLSLGSDDEQVDEQIVSIRTDFESVAKRAFSTVKNNNGILTETGEAPSTSVCSALGKLPTSHQEDDT